MSFNPLLVILSQNRLIGDNFIDWKRNLNIVLTSEKHKFMLLEACPPRTSMFGETSTRAQFEAVKTIMNSRMKVGMSVRDHLLRIMAHFNEAEIHGSSIDQQTQNSSKILTLTKNDSTTTTTYSRLDLGYL
ncbi:hypothetical protein UlMin_019511 [Ulmus minor]